MKIGYYFPKIVQEGFLALGSKGKPFLGPRREEI
jgi:hypothetical protein